MWKHVAIHQKRCSCCSSVVCAVGKPDRASNLDLSRLSQQKTKKNSRLCERNFFFLGRACIQTEPQKILLALQR